MANDSSRRNLICLAMNASIVRWNSSLLSLSCGYENSRRFSPEFPLSPLRICGFLQELSIEFRLHIVAVVGVLSDYSAGIGDKSGDDGVGNDENEVRASDEGGETAEVVAGDLDGEREASEDPIEEKQRGAEFKNTKCFGNAVKEAFPELGVEFNMGSGKVLGAVIEQKIYLVVVVLDLLRLLDRLPLVSSSTHVVVVVPELTTTVNRRRR
ncbi:hypothetical protein G2W53_020053 [Senna tora]|uniref:Uncharacterized protein n=1 Tax=Senna tora TaxID=362788 RepID=A0A834WS78_9FABA|nr:hypothetical protein G2W53_020053 [Senna tora]